MIRRIVTMLFLFFSAVLSSEAFANTPEKKIHDPENSDPKLEEKISDAVLYEPGLSKGDSLRGRVLSPDSGRFELNSTSKFNFLFYFIYKYKYEDGLINTL